MKLGRAALFGAVLCVALAVSTYFLAPPSVVDGLLNGRTGAQQLPLTEHGQELHSSIEVVADLHCDALLWPGRSLTERRVSERRGHVDLARMHEGNLGLQAFFAPTKVPWTINVHFNRNTTWDLLTALYSLPSGGEDRPSDLLQRAVYIADRLHQSAAESAILADGGKEFQVVQTADELQEFLTRRQAARSASSAILPLAGILGIEGLHCAGGDIAALDVLHGAGFRLLGLAHFFDNELGGSAHGEEKSGLTPLGVTFVKRMEELRMTVDLAHASPAVIDDVLAMATRPVLFSHTGVYGTCASPRNIADDHIKATARLGGLIGIGFWVDATCGQSAREVAEAIRYVADLVGVEYVALGSDWDGAVRVNFGADEVSQVTEALLLHVDDNGQRRFTDQEIGLIMGGNTVRFLLNSL